MCKPLIRVLGGRWWCPRRRGGLRAWLASGPTAWDKQEAAVEEIEVGPAEHLALQHFQPVDMALDGTVAPGQRHPGFDGVIVLIQPRSKASQGLQGTGGRPLQPR